MTRCGGSSQPRGNRLPGVWCIIAVAEPIHPHGGAAAPGPRHSRRASAWASRNWQRYLPSRASSPPCGAAGDQLRDLLSGEASPATAKAQGACVRRTVRIRSRAPRPAILQGPVAHARLAQLVAQTLLPTHLVTDCWQRPRTHARSVWTVLVLQLGQRLRLLRLCQHPYVQLLRHQPSAAAALRRGQWQNPGQAWHARQSGSKTELA